MPNRSIGILILQHQSYLGNDTHGTADQLREGIEQGRRQRTCATRCTAIATGQARDHLQVGQLAGQRRQLRAGRGVAGEEVCEGGDGGGGGGVEGGAEGGEDVHGAVIAQQWNTTGRVPGQ